MSILSSNKCKAKDPSKCPYHGAASRMKESLTGKDIAGYLKAKEDLERASESELDELKLSSPDSRDPNFFSTEDKKSIAAMKVDDDGYVNIHEFTEWFNQQAQYLHRVLTSQEVRVGLKIKSDFNYHEDSVHIDDLPKALARIRSYYWAINRETR